jgi:O-antigen ligase
VNLSEKKIDYAIIGAGLLFIVLNALFIANGFFLLNVIPAVMLLVLLAFISLDRFVFIIVALVPLSISLREVVPHLSFDLNLPTEPMIILAMLIFILKFLHEGYFDRKIILHPISIAIFIYLAWILITSFTSTMPLVSFKFLASRLWFIIVFYFLATQLFIKYKNMVRYIWLYTISLIPVIIYFIIRLSGEGITNQRAAVWVVEPFYNDHTAYGAALAMIFCSLIGLYILRKNASNSIKFFYALTIITTTIAILLSYTRAAWLSMIVTSGLLIALLLKIKLKYIFTIAGIVIACIIMYSSEIFMALEKNKQDSSNSLSKHLQSMTNVRSDDSNRERINRWNSAIRMFNDKPVFGFGPGTYAFKYAPYQRFKDKTMISTNRGDVGNAHSEYIGPLAESGLLGTLSFIAVVIATMITASKLYFKSKRRKVRILAITLLIALFTYYVHGFLNDFLDTDKLSVLFWGFTAMIVALDVYHENNAQKTKKELS